MEEKNQQDRFLGVDREWGDDPEGRVKVEGGTSRIQRVVLDFPIVFFPY
jgi:hypothetical protein